MTSKILEKLSLYHHCQKLLLKLKSFRKKQDKELSELLKL